MSTATNDGDLTAATAVTPNLLDYWATDARAPVALHLKQKLLPIEGEGGVIFPPTYADIGYNIDTLSDGTNVATIDSVGSQANRMEPIFKKSVAGAPANKLSELVPQIEILLRTEKKGETEHQERLSLLDLAHRSADAVVQSSPTLSAGVEKAFEALRLTGDAWPMCALAPTSLVFGVWDSRGGTGEKRPRLVRLIIRAWGVERLHAAAQFSSVWKALDEGQQAELSKEADKQKTKLSVKGLADAPAVFRKVGQGAAKHLHEFRDGAPNPERRILGGVLAGDRIEREVTINLVALRNTRGKDPEETKQVQKYLLGLSLLAATADIDLFLREGCHLRYAGVDAWSSVPRRGEPSAVNLGTTEARETLEAYAEAAVVPFKTKWPKELLHAFDIKGAKKLLAKKEEEGPPGE